MTSCDFNDQGFNNNFNVFDNNSHLFEQFCEKKLKIDELNRRQETAIKDVFFKDNNASYSTISFRDTNKFSSDSFIYGVTESDSKILLNKKRKQEINSDENNNGNNLEEDNFFKKEDIISLKGNSKRGRRKKNVEYDDEPHHDKFTEDNIIQRIKTFIFDYILERLNKSLKYESRRFYQLTKTLNSNLKKDFNEELLGKTIYEIYMTSDLCMRFINIPDANRELIKKIYEEKIEIETMNILEKKFKEILDYIRKKDLDNFLTNFRLRVMKKDNKLIDLYMKEVRKMLFQYEFYFQKKIGRNTKKV